MEEIDQGWQLFNTKNNLNNLIDFSLISFGNSLYTFGGYEKESNQITNQLREFNFETNAWKYKNLESISERISHTGTVRNGKLYILGGSNESYLKDFHCYNFELDHVALFPSLKNGIAGHTCILNERDNNFYIVGGNLDDGTPNEDLLCFDFEVGEWKTIDFTGEPPLLVDHSCICYGSKMYTFGGTDSKTSNFSNSIYEFDFKLSKWKKLLISGNTDIIPTPRSRHSCVQFYHTFIIHGGSTSSNVFLNDMWIFDLDSLIWTEIDQNSQNSLFVPSPRRDHKIVIHSDSIFLFGGKEKIGKANDKKIFKFELLKNPVFSKFEKQIYFKKSEENIGNIFSFGYGAHGQLGHNNNDNLDYPKKIESLLNEKIIKICCGGGHSVCLTTKGQLYLWGDGRTSAIPQIKPRKITEFRNDFVLNVACGSLHTIAVLADENGHPGPVYVWGDEISTTKSQPRLVNSLFGKKIIDLDCTALETIVLTDDSFIYSWSIESETQLKLVATNETHNFTKITCGGGHTLILTSTGKLLSFGFKCKHGQLGRGQYDENQDSTTPEEIEYFAENNIKVGTMACGDDHSLVVDENGDLFTFGYGHNGQLGHQNLESQFYPKKVQFLEGKKIFQVAGGGGLGCSHSVVVCVSGEIYVFGSNSHSQLGFEASKICLKPYLLNFNELTFQVSCGWIHTLLLVEKKEDFENALEEIDPNNTMGCFGICPNFILDDILLLLDWREIGKLSLVSSSFKNISERNEIWSSLFYRQFAESNLMEFAGKSSKQKFKSRFNPQKVESSSSTSIFSKVSMKIGSLFVGKNEFRILMPGMDAAGKTTVLYKLKLGETVTTIPTIGFNVETVDYKKASLTVWDVGGPDKIRPLWRHYYQNTQAIIWVVDSNDRERQDEYREELHKMLNDDEMRDAILLVYANKQDLPNALSVAEASCATTGDGLYEGLDWLVSELMK